MSFVRIHPTGEEATSACRDAGLPGWRCVISPASSGGYLVALSSPDYHPLKKTGRLIARHGRDAAEAFALAVEVALELSPPTHH